MARGKGAGQGRAGDSQLHVCARACVCMSVCMCVCECVCARVRVCSRINECSMDGASRARAGMVDLSTTCPQPPARSTPPCFQIRVKGSKTPHAQFSVQTTRTHNATVATVGRQKAAPGGLLSYEPRPAEDAAAAWLGRRGRSSSCVGRGSKPQAQPRPCGTSPFTIPPAITRSPSRMAFCGLHACDHCSDKCQLLEVHFHDEQEQRDAIQVWWVCGG